MSSARRGSKYVRAAIALRSGAICRYAGDSGTGETSFVSEWAADMQGELRFKGFGLSLIAARGTEMAKGLARILMILAPELVVRSRLQHDYGVCIHLANTETKSFCGMDDSNSITRSSSQDSPLTAVTTPEMASEDDDVWASDDNHDLSHNISMREAQSDVLSDLPSVKRQHMTDGYREGLSTGKARVMQRGFDAGYPIGIAIAMRAGKVLGCIEGVLAAKDISDETKAPVRRMMARAREELAISALLKDMNDQDIMSFTGVPATAHNILSRWEVAVFGKAPSSEDDTPKQD